MKNIIIWTTLSQECFRGLLIPNQFALAAFLRC